MKTYLLGAKTKLGDKKYAGEDISIVDSNLKDKMGIQTVSEFTDKDEYNSVTVIIEQILEEFGLGHSDVDGIFCSSTGTYDVLPGLANVIGARLGLSKEKPRINVGSACAGAIQALYFANNEMKKRKEESGKDQIFLVIASDIRSKTKDPITMPMMSDSSGVMLISTKQLGKSDAYEIDNIALNSTEADETTLRAIEQKHHNKLTMSNGKAVYRFAVQTGIEIFDTFVKGTGGVIFYIPHNANAKINGPIVKAVGNRAEVRIESIKEGNLGGVSMIHGLETVLKRKPDQIVGGGFGAEFLSGGVGLIKAVNREDESIDYILPNLSLDALKHGKVWEFKEMKDTKTIGLSEINESLVGYEYVSPEMCITQELVDFFISIVGDNNPHYDENTAQETKLGQPPVPGSLQQSMITNGAVIHNALKVSGSNHLVVENNFKFKRPILVGDKVQYKLKVLSAGRGIVERDTRICVKGEERGRGMFKSFYQKK